MKTRDLTICALFAAIIAVLAQISIPFPGGVPLTMQTLAVALCGIILGPKLGGISVLIYVCLGAIGLPVFSNLSGGLQSIVGSTGGFIISFPIMAYVIGKISENKKNKLIVFGSLILASVINYTLGTIQFSLVTGNSIIMAITYCVAPFIITDLIKAVIATIVGTSLVNLKAIKEILKH
ncbi:BioY family protein [Candidatus Epulonipiscium fishelsonii]|uniref:BioY family protein n=1 Tax=Candidatus Epulonipiscium fishelsonii TaxID=77094 RepID=A0ACC8XIA8_9FIRM|nr:BioY family protein [Epulopiscium sp. SCG-D08WGA-EpuloA1]